jgi:hypothetical protein
VPLVPAERAICRVGAAPREQAYGAWWTARRIYMNRLLIVGILIISTAPLFAQAQPDPAKLKAEAQKVVSIISGDKAKTQTYCQIADLGEQIDREKDRKKAEALFQKMNELEKQLGPEYLALIEATKELDPNSKDGQDIVSMFDRLDGSCPH